MTVRKFAVVALVFSLIPMAAAFGMPDHLMIVGPGAIGVTSDGNVAFGYDVEYLQTPQGLEAFSRVAREVWQRTALLPMPHGEELCPMDGATRYFLELNTHGDIAKMEQIVALLLDLLLTP